MRTQKELLIATKAYAREVRWLSWWHLWSTLAVVALLLAFVCTNAAVLLRLPVSLVLGMVIVRMFVLYHDHQHGAILRGSRLADAVMQVFGLVILSPSSGWKRSHDHHHAHNSRLPGPNIGSYPLMTVSEYRAAPRKTRLRYVIERHPLTMLLGYVSVFLVGMCILPLLANPRRHFDAVASILLHCGLLVWLASDEIDDLFLAMLVPCSVASAVGAWLFYAQHNFPSARVLRRENWNHVTAALESSSYIEMSPIGRWLTGNIGFHHVHHLNSRIPFYRLPEAMAAFEELQSPPTISLHPRDMLACLRLNLWDPRTERLVSWSALRKPRELPASATQMRSNAA